MPMSSTVQPASNNPAATACRSISPLGRPSRETTTLLPAMVEPNAAANRAATSAVRPLPTSPRTPDTDTINTGALAMRESLRECGLGNCRRSCRNSTLPVGSRLNGGPHDLVEEFPQTAAADGIDGRQVGEFAREMGTEVEPGFSVLPRWAVPHAAGKDR